MKKIILLILDGFGIRESENGNAIKMASLPNLTKIMTEFPVAELDASSEAVGLPKGSVGNSEVGHMTIGSGRVVTQPLTLIDSKIKDKTFFENDVLLDLMDHVNDNNSTLHLVGLLSNGAVHSSIDHFYASLALAKIKKVKNVVFHFITDGKDTLQTSGAKFINAFMEKASKLGIGTIGTICGRYYAMDNDNNYDRTKKAYDAIIYNIGNNFSDYNRCMELHYKSDITDEYINPSIITKGSNVNDQDGVLFINFRLESMSQLVDAMVDPSFNMFNTKKLKNVMFASLYNVDDKVECAYSNETLSNTFGSYLASLDFKQSRIAETEKYPNVTYFFDGGEEFTDKNLYKILVPSPKVARYDMRPEMSVVDVTTAVLDSIDDDFDFILVNFANPDLVGHTGNIPATIRALEACDVCIGKILEKAQENFYELVITSDHGNCEYMKDSEGNTITANTTNKVPFIICNNKYNIKNEGSLKDVIPTIIDMYEISKPKEMTGESLLIK
ncbi:MAG: 2,3-bisphosphoglycerate-independent phosphoglycerate mutase [Tenericutes bacterium]|nr:2,3-bisphosphoglycerate-independent phosphoglycerate mutase [Mycoplasmatota bacterium]